MIEANDLVAENPELTPEIAYMSPEVVVDDNESRKGEQGSKGWYVLVIGLLVGGVAGFFLRPLVVEDRTVNLPLLGAVASSAEINEASPHQAVMMTVIANARHFNGDPNAPVTIVEFGDFNCGYCGKWAREVLPKINDKYVETGKVRMAYVHYPILGADSMKAAEAAECAGQQDRFWDYHLMLYSHQGIGYTSDNLKKLAEEMGLDTKNFHACLEDFADRAPLEDDIRLSQVMGVRGTPAFLVNGIPLAGAYPYEDFETVIEGSLAGDY